MTADSRQTLHIYNARCALTVEPTRNRRGDVHTVNLESAVRTQAGKEFDWADKIVLQVTGAELPDALAVVLGHLPAVEFRYHGAARDKGYRIFHDGERLVVQLFAGARDRHAVALGRADRLAVGVAMFRQLQRNHGGLSADVLHAMLVSIYAPAVVTGARATLQPTDGAGQRGGGGEDVRTPTSERVGNASRPPDEDVYDW